MQKNDSFFYTQCPVFSIVNIFSVVHLSQLMNQFWYIK